MNLVQEYMKRHNIDRLPIDYYKDFYFLYRSQNKYYRFTHRQRQDNNHVSSYSIVTSVYNNEIFYSINGSKVGIIRDPVTNFNKEEIIYWDGLDNVIVNQFFSLVINKCEFAKDREQTYGLLYKIFLSSKLRSSNEYEEMNNKDSLTTEHQSFMHMNVDSICECISLSIESSAFNSVCKKVQNAMPLIIKNCWDNFCSYQMSVFDTLQINTSILNLIQAKTNKGKA